MKNMYLLVLAIIVMAGCKTNTNTQPKPVDFVAIKDTILLIVD